MEKDNTKEVKEEETESILASMGWGMVRAPATYGELVEMRRKAEDELRKEIEEDEEEEEEEDDHDEEGKHGASIQSSRIRKFMEFEMASGGDHWYLYRIYFDTKHGEQEHINRVDKHGERVVFRDKRAIIRTLKDGSERLKFVDDDYELNEDEEMNLYWYE